MNILLVDDEMESRRSVADFLRELGHNVEESADGLDALNKYFHGAYDLVMSDIMMPLLSGIELLRKIRETNGSAKVVLFTGCSSHEIDMGAILSGADAYLLKPLNIKDLIKLTK